MHNSYPLKDKHVLITGCNGQLGSTLVLRFAEAGARVCATDMQPTISSELKKSLGKNTSFVEYQTLDVRKEASIRAVAKKLKQLDILVNNAGVSVFTPFEERTEQEIDEVMEVNLKGTILCSKVFAEIMAKQNDGRVINIASIYGVVPADKKIYGDSGRNNSEIYGATKAGVIQLTKYLAAYLGEKGIRVNAVSPGGIFANQKKFFLDNYVDKTPLKRMATTDDIANAVLFLVSPDSEYITGQNITVDGGFSLNQ